MELMSIGGAWDACCIRW